MGPHAKTSPFTFAFQWKVIKSSEKLRKKVQELLGVSLFVDGRSGMFCCNLDSTKSNSASQHFIQM